MRVISLSGDIPTWFQQWLDKLPSTNWKLWWSMVLVIATVAFDMLCIAGLFVWQHTHPGVELVHPPLVDEFLYSLHFTVLAINGVSYAQFRTKRNTYAAPSPDSERADVPARPAPSEPAKPAALVVATPSTAAPASAALPPMPTLGLYNAADVVAVSGGAAAGDDERTDDEVVEVRR